MIITMAKVFITKYALTEGIKEIEDNYMEFSKNATTFYESTDNIKTYKEILKDLGET